MNAQIIAVANQKGGVGKTTTTAALGIGLAQQGKRVLLIDSDAQASLTLSLGYDRPDQLPMTLADLFQQSMDGVEAEPGRAILHHSEGVDLIPGDISLANTELRLISAMNRERILQYTLAGERKNYDYILIDCSPSLGILTVNALAAAQSVIIPTQPAYLSVKGLDLLLHSIANVRRQINPRLRVDGILFTFVDRRTNEAKDIIATVQALYADTIRIFRTEIPFSVRAAEASGLGKSIYLHDGSGKVAAAYGELVKEVDRIERQNHRSRHDAVR